MKKKYIILGILFVTITLLIYCKPAIYRLYTGKVLKKTKKMKIYKLFLGFQNRPFLLYNEEIEDFKKILLKSFTLDTPSNKFCKIFKAKLVDKNGSAIYIYFSQTAWCFTDSTGKVGTSYLVKNFPKRYYQKLFFMTSFKKPQDYPPELPEKLSKDTRNNLTLFFCDLNSSSSLNKKRLAAYFQMLHDNNALNVTYLKNRTFADKISKHLLKNKNNISYNDFLLTIGAIQCSESESK